MNTQQNETPSLAKKLLNNVRVNMLAGILLIVPLVVTIVILQFLFGLFESLISPIITLAKAAHISEHLTVAISIMVFLCLIYLIGLVSTHMLGNRIMKFAERLVLRIPIVKSVYSSTKQAVELLSQSNRTAFKSVVLVEFPCSGSKTIAFMIGSLTDQHGNTRIKVLVPTCPSPLTAFLLFLDPAQVETTDISVEDGIKMVVSGGIVSPDTIALHPYAR